MKYKIITFGCQMNKADSERIATILECKGYKPTIEINEADLIVVNMCSVRQSAVDRVFGLIQKFNKLKIQNPRLRHGFNGQAKLKTILTGCILKKDRPKFVKGFDEILKFKDLLKYKPKYKYKPIAYIPISNGCNNACTYCVVPYVRGPLVCRDHKEIIKETERAVKQGFKEIWLLGQNVNNYKSKVQNPKPKTINFPKLLEMINSVPGDFSIRFTSPHPKDFSEELIDTMAKCKKVAHYLNLPVQSGDNEILRKMNRPYTVGQYKNLVKKIRKKIPDINLSTDIIVGFPGETKKQFENTVKLFKEMKFDIAYIAKYSPRPGTAAEKLIDDVPYQEKRKRYEILTEILRETTQDQNKK